MCVCFCRWVQILSDTVILHQTEKNFIQDNGFEFLSVIGTSEMGGGKGTNHGVPPLVANSKLMSLSYKMDTGFLSGALEVQKKLV